MAVYYVPVKPGRNALTEVRPEPSTLSAVDEMKSDPAPTSAQDIPVDISIHVVIPFVWLYSYDL